MSRCGLGAQAALLATLTLVACGGGEESDASGGISVSELEDAGLDFARCMRGRGIDVPDPQPGAGDSGQGGAPGGLDLDDPRAQEAMEACSERGPGLRLAE
jgi:hypothetical protein